jgi:hypothetical protein
MAFLTRHFFSDMSSVVEHHVLRQIIRFSPGRGGLGVEIPMFFFDLRMIGNNVFMAVETLLHRGEPRVAGARHIGMTEGTLDLLDSRMHTMAEGDGLLGTQVFCRRYVKQIKESKHEKEAES